MRSILLAVWLLVGVPGLTHAQSEFDLIKGLFKSINSVSFSTQMGGLTGSDEMVGDCGFLDLCGLGTEVFFNLASDSTKILELALGTGYLRGFSAREESLDLRGSVRSVPTIGVYASRPGAFGSDRVLPYVGATIGLSELWNVQAYDLEGKEYSVKGSTYDFGVLTGVAVDAGALDGLFLEGVYRYRNFASVDWSGDRVPPRWPRGIDLTGIFISAGWQFDIPTPGK